METRHFLLLACAFWAAFGLIAGILVWISMIDHEHSVPWLLLYYQVIWLAWLAPTYLIARLQQRVPVVPLRPVAALLHAAAATVIAVLHGLYEALVMVSLQPFDRRTAALSEIDFSAFLFSRLPIEWVLYCLVLGGVVAFEYYQRYHERALLAAQLERSLADARLHALESQLRPHFLFNTLNAIAGLVRGRRNDEAVTMVAGLADLLRYSLDRAERQRVPLAEELDMVERYLGIELARFPDRLRFRIEADTDARRALVPSLILQPLVENAVRHGIAMSAAPGAITLDARRVDDRLQLRLSNSGTLDPARGDGIGLRNTRERLRTLYGDAALFDVRSAEDGVLATLDLPWQAA